MTSVIKTNVKTTKAVANNNIIAAQHGQVWTEGSEGF